ncbi:Cytochrome b561 and DOMON domain-containing protein [Arachis hypogaea]|nr:Cytochrome b561 and DOMON domain-containing protein [Arachis hypogaea]
MHNIILKYGRASSNVWSFIFSFPSSINAYAAIGFSNDGKMVKSSAIVGWISGLNGGGMNQYYLGGLSDGEVVPGEGDLYVMNETIIQPNPSIVYMIFQLKTNQPSSKLIYSIGPNGVFPDTQGKLQQHSDAISTVIDYSQG